MAIVFVLRRSGPVMVTAAMAICGFLLADSCPAQSASAPQATGSAQSAVNPDSNTSPAMRHKHRVTAKTEAQPAPVDPPHPPDPPPPDWPVNDKAQPASVDWNGRDLRIAATNSSLEQILKDVSTATGVQVEGVAADQRIFGSYGPASARDVLSQLLDGSGYNVMMVGDKGEGTPRTLVLSAKSAEPLSHIVGANARSRPNSEDEAPEDPEPVEAPEPAGARHGVPPIDPSVNKSPQQIMQEMQQRQQQLQQQNQQNQQAPPAPQPMPQPPNN